MTCIKMYSHIYMVLIKNMNLEYYFQTNIKKLNFTVLKLKKDFNYTFLSILVIKTFNSLEEFVDKPPT